MRRPLRERDLAGFPPGRTFLALPRQPRRAAWAGLALYDAVEPIQRLALTLGRAALRAGAARVLPENSPELDWGWWESWVAEAAEPEIGEVGHVAWRVPPNGRSCGLLLDREGTPLGFVKILDTPRPTFSAAVREVLGRAQLRHVNVPATIAEGHHRGRHYLLQETMPPGAHRRPPRDAARVAAVVDEFQDHLSVLERPPDVPDHHRVCHTGFTPRNLRVASDGTWWLFDWDYVRWGPRLACELRYWAADHAYRRRVDPQRAAEAVVDVLRSRGDDEEILEAVEWPGQLQTYRAVEVDIHRAVGRLVGEP